MKKLLVLTLFLLTFTLYACNSTDETHINIMVPNGSPAISQMAFEYEQPSIENMTYTIERVSGPDALVAAFGSESHEIIFAPTNVGARLISTGAPYSFAATVNWGNLHLASGSNIDTLSDLEGREIIAFGQNATPDIVLQTIIDGHDFTDAPTITYVDSAQAAGANLVEDPTRIVLLAEPVLSVMNNQVEAMQTLDLQRLWEDTTGESSYPQAGIFVHNDVSDQLVEDYLSEIEQAVQKLLSDPETVAAYGETLDYPFPTAIIAASIPRSNITFTNANESRDALEVYFNKILERNSALLNNEMPDDDFYR